MSASSKKKIRKEQSAAMLTEKQQQEKAEAKKLKAYTVGFVCVLVLVVCIALGTLIGGIVSRSGVMEKKTVAASVGDHQLNTVQMSYYYNNAISGTINQWQSTFGGMYAQLVGLDLTKPLSSQIQNAETNETWADYFLNIALKNAASDYALADKAAAEGHTLTDDEKAVLDNQLQMPGIYAQMGGFPSAKDYLVAMYGYGADEASYAEYAQRNALAASYYQHHQNSLKYDDEALRAYEKDRYNEFSSYSYNGYSITLDAYKNTDQDAEENTGKDPKILAEADAKLLVKATTAEELDKAIAKLPVNKDKKDVASTAYTNVLYGQLSDTIKQWLSSSDRKAGDITYLPIENTTKDEDGKETTTLTGYYVVRFQSSTENLEPLANVRHILVEFEGGTKDDKGMTVYSDAEKATAKKEAEAILGEWKKGDMTDESFAALAKEKTDDTASKETGGLIEDITPVSRYVTNFLNWSIDPAREAGDTGIIESEYGYHIMYYVGDDALTYRDFMITNALTNKDMTEWYEEILKSVTYALADTSRLNKDIVLAG